tara:strand:- start:44 stop:607 length:564 start_codon:yes stop_codon:yes gene_type:complete
MKTQLIKYHLPIFHEIVNNYGQLNHYLKNVINEYRESFPQSNTSNVKAWHSEYKTHEKTDKFDPLIGLVTNACYHVSKEYFNTPIGGDWKFVCNNLWVAMYTKDDYTIPHSHYPATYSACYYVEVDDGCSPIVFGADEKRNGCFDEITIQPENGMLLLWNGMIPHQVLPTEGKRTCICMNFHFTETV